MLCIQLKRERIIWNTSSQKDTEKSTDLCCSTHVITQEGAFILKQYTVLPFSRRILQSRSRSTCTRVRQWRELEALSDDWTETLDCSIDLLGSLITHLKMRTYLSINLEFYWDKRFLVTAVTACKTRLSTRSCSIYGNCNPFTCETLLILILMYLLTLLIRWFDTSNQRSGWSSWWSPSQVSTSHHLLCVQC